MIVLKHMARVELPEEHRREVLEMYFHTARNGDTIQNYKYANGVAYLPLNPRKLEKVAALLGEEISDQRSMGAPLSQEVYTLLRPDFKLRPHQVVPTGQLLHEVLSNHYAVIQAGCGLGKTVVMSWVAGSLGVKILIIVDMGSLLSQWEEAFQMIWGVQLQILDRDDTKFSDVCITTFQLLHLNPALLKRVSKEFGVLLLDEFHTTQSATRREILFRLDNYYRIGCTATPFKKGYTDEVLTDLVADVSVTMLDEHALKPDVTFIETGVQFYSANADDWGKISSKLAKNERRNQILVQLIWDLLADNRKVLFIGITIEQCQCVCREVKRYAKARPVVYTGSTTLVQDKQLKVDVVTGKVNCVLTVKKFDKGTDVPLLDALVVGRPHNNQAFLEQISGRIVRPVPGKPHPLIYDCHDKGSLADTFARNRTRWYRKLGYRILASKTVDKCYVVDK